jgi:hypothetical protein
MLTAGPATVQPFCFFGDWHGPQNPAPKSFALWTLLPLALAFFASRLLSGHWKGNQSLTMWGESDPSSPLNSFWFQTFGLGGGLNTSYTFDFCPRHRSGSQAISTLDRRFGLPRRREIKF